MVDEIDLSILKILQKDTRISYREIAKEVGVSVGTVHNRIKKMVENGVITDFIPVINPKMLGMDFTAVIMVKTPKPPEDLKEEYLKFKEIMQAYSITGVYDLVLIGRFKGREGLNNFINKILNLGLASETTTSVVLSILKEDFRLPIPEEEQT